MLNYQAPTNDMLFVLNDLLSIDVHEQLCTSNDDYLSPEIQASILNECGRIAANEMQPLNRTGDEVGLHFEEGMVTTPKGFKALYNRWAQGEWIGLCGEEAYGGMGAPKSLAMAVGEMVFASNSGFALYPELATGAAHLIARYANESLKSHYLPKLYSGEWSATMCLTESHCGSDLGLLKTKAEWVSNSTYKISGEKIFISGGEHDLTDNIVHLVLARLPNAPAGVKGISLFLVPKIISLDRSSLKNNGGVKCIGIEEKMGIKAAATCVMSFEEAEGYLVGEPHKGLEAMFLMMNFERLSISMQGLGLGSMSYQTALAYAKDRIQGKDVRQPEKGSVPIINHGDVRRMLLTMKCLNEGGRAFALYTASFCDKSEHSEDANEKQEAFERLSLLTPVVKAFVTDMGFDTCVLGQQILGGHGYIREWGQEQHVRDARIAQIYEGSNGIQALDLLGRKVLSDKGHAFKLYVKEINNYVTGCTSERVKHLAALLHDALSSLVSLTMTFIEQSEKNIDFVNGSAVEYLHLVGYVSYAYLWLRSAVVAENKLATGVNEDKTFFLSKISTAEFYFYKILPRTEGLVKSLRAGISAIDDFDEALF